jgi:hypothetical protein
MLTLPVLAAAAALATCNFGHRAADAPKELEQYAFLVGNHHIVARGWDTKAGNWQKSFLETRWDGRWALGGHAIYDEWTGPVPPGSNEKPVLGANFRMWDAAHQRWSNMWMEDRHMQTTDILSKMEDGKMVMWQVYPKPDPKWKAVFDVHKDGSWTRTQYVKNADGAFVPRFRLDATLLPCEPGKPAMKAGTADSP